MNRKAKLLEEFRKDLMSELEKASVDPVFVNKANHYLIGLRVYIQYQSEKIDKYEGLALDHHYHAITDAMEETP